MDIKNTTLTDVFIPVAKAPKPSPLASEIEADAMQELEAAYRHVEELEAAANEHADSIASFRTGIKHDESYYRKLDPVDGSGPRLEQILTNLPED